MPGSLALQSRMRYNSLSIWLPSGFNSWRQGYSRDTEAQDSWHGLAVSYQKVAIQPSLEEQGFTLSLGQLAMIVRQIHGGLSYALAALATWDQVPGQAVALKREVERTEKGKRPFFQCCPNKTRDCSVGSVSFTRLRKWEGRGDKVTKTFQPRGGWLKYDSQKRRSGWASSSSVLCVGCSSNTGFKPPWYRLQCVRLSVVPVPPLHPHPFSSLMAISVLSEEHTADPAILDT